MRVTLTKRLLPPPTIGGTDTGLTYMEQVGDHHAFHRVRAHPRVRLVGPISTFVAPDLPEAAKGSVTAVPAHFGIYSRYYALSEMA